MAGSFGILRSEYGYMIIGHSGEGGHLVKAALDRLPDTYKSATRKAYRGHVHTYFSFVLAFNLPHLCSEYSILAFVEFL